MCSLARRRRACACLVLMLIETFGGIGPALLVGGRSCAQGGGVVR